MEIRQALEEIKSRLDIVDFISEHLDLRRSGSNFKALCPFHNEKTPSFMVSPEKQIFHCFGCGTGGDIVTFVMKYEGLPFVDAVKRLSARAGISIDEPRRQGGHRSGISRSDLLETNKKATLFFRKKLFETPLAINYLKDRGITEDTSQTFSLGFAPPGRTNLLEHLLKDGVKEEVILRAGLCKDTENGRIDTFRNRIIFPITNISGEVIAFGGRAIKKDFPGPKYINSPDTPLFHKSSALFGLSHARKEIAKKGYVILMEGYLDVITSYQAGIKNAVAPLGTALTDGQVRRLKNLTRNALLVFDSDDAGIKATRRALKLLYKNGITGKVLLLAPGDDPDSFIRKHGAKGFRSLFPHSKGLVEFFLTLNEDRVDILREVLYIISDIKDAILRGELIRELSEKTDLPEAFLREELRGIRTGDEKERITLLKGEDTPERHLLGIFINYPDYRSKIKEALLPELFYSQKYKQIFEKLFSTDFKEISEIKDIFTDEEFSSITSSAISCDIDSEEIGKNIDDSVAKLYNMRKKRRIKEIESNLRIAEKSGDDKKVDTLKKELDKLIKEGLHDGVF
ncbi:MAG: DNA primase [Nitrospirae bacterium]|nr:MAG: DNA primase [Nitrospirota bacterium]